MHTHWCCALLHGNCDENKQGNILYTAKVPMDYTKFSKKYSIPASKTFDSSIFKCIGIVAILCILLLLQCAAQFIINIIIFVIIIMIIA